MTVKTIAEFQAEGRSPEILFWVGCAGSYDARAQKVTRALCEILEHAGVAYAILGQEERCWVIRRGVPVMNSCFR